MTASAPAELEVNIDKQRLAAIYAQALLGTTEKRGMSEAVVAELDSLVDDVLQRFPELEMALATPRITPTEKAAMLDRIFGGRMSADLLNFLKIVGRRGRLDCLRSIRRAARNELNRLRRRVAVQVTTATPLSEELKNRIRDRLQAMLGSEVDLQCRQDPAILAGLVVRVGDRVYDGSVANQLTRMRQDTITKMVHQLHEALDRFAVSS
jgi:F-type H+-transporting ATPase subunit delta